MVMADTGGIDYIRGYREVGRSRIRKIKSTNMSQYQPESNDIFFMSLEEAKAAISDKYEQLAERYEVQYPKHKGIT